MTASWQQPFRAPGRGSQPERAAFAGRSRPCSRAPRPARVAGQFHDAIERSPRKAPGALRRCIVRQIAGENAAPAPRRLKTRIATAASIAFDLPSMRPRLLVDVPGPRTTGFSRRGSSGSSRAVLRRLLEHPPKGWRVRACRRAGPIGIVYARAPACTCRLGDSAGDRYPTASR